MRHYSDCFGIRPDYAPVMTLADINKAPETWLGFYPHESFVSILRDLLATFNGERLGHNQARTLWITGAYGTGKSHASLVLQKLFNDDDARVEKWLDLRRNQIPDAVRKALLARRREKVLVVYDVNSDGVDAKNQFLMRLQRGIATALADANCHVPLKGRLDVVIERVREEGPHFWAARDAMQEKLQHLNAGIKTAEALEKRLRQENGSAGLASDVMKVLEARSIYLDLEAESFLGWVDAALDVNKISRLVYVFDEFSSFIERNRTELKTFEQLAEASTKGRFFFIPVTHLELVAFFGDRGTESAKKANNRFEFKRLEMPNDTALKLAADAFVEKPQIAEEWQKDRVELWSGVRTLTENYMAPNGSGIAPEDFKGILPVHPMAAFLLKHLAVAIGSNQRSMFGFLNGDEFRDFSVKGGLEVAGRQFLTADHLWTYFIERDDLGTDKRLQEARTEFSRREPELQPEERRVYKTVLLFSLVEEMMGAGSPLLSVSVENIRRCFEGDGMLTGVESVLRNLESKHCFSIVNGRCERFHDRADTEKISRKIDELKGKFDELVLDDTQAEIEKQIRSGNPGGRFAIRVGSVDSLTASKIPNRERFGDKGNRILVQFILAKDEHEQLRIPDKTKDLARQFKDHRMLFVALPETSFCRDNAKAWDEFVESSARLADCNDNASRKVYETQLNGVKQKWHGAVRAAAKLVVITPNENGEPYSEETTWILFGKKLAEYARRTFAAYTDDLSGYNVSAFGSPSSLQNWALAGMRFDAFDKPGAWKAVIANYQREGIRGNEAWFDENPNHALTQLRDFCKKRQDNTVGAGNTCSIRKLYIDLQRPPYGLLCVPHSAFVLGFVLKGWLEGQRKLQWTDGVQSMALDAQTLAEIIEAVVKDDGAGEIKSEKLICRLSKEEKAFIEQCGTIFGYQPAPNGTIEGALQQIEGALERISERVPLWVLPDAIRAAGDPNAEAMCEVLDKICAANSISSKGNTEERGNKVKQIGEILLGIEGLASALHGYMTPLSFANAFQAYVDTAKPDLKTVAKRLGDTARAYCGDAKKRLAQTAGWLWKRGDVDTVLDEVLRQYQCAEAVRDLAGTTGFLTFDDAVRRLKSAVFAENKIPVEFWTRKQPALSRFFELLSRPLAGQQDAAALEEVLRQQRDSIKDLFFDGTRKSQYVAMGEIFASEWPSVVAESRDLYNAFPVDFVSLPEQAFIQQGREEIEKFRASLTSKRLSQIWKEKTGTESPDEWSRNNNLPAEFALKVVDARSVAEVVANPGGASPERLQAVLKAISLQGAFATVEEARAQFLDRVLPHRYMKLGFGADELAVTLRDALGSDANRWLSDSRLGGAVEAFVRASYKTHTRAKASERVKTMSDAQAKALLLKIIDDLPDAGLRALE